MTKWTYSKTASLKGFPVGEVVEGVREEEEQHPHQDQFHEKEHHQEVQGSVRSAGDH